MMGMKDNNKREEGGLISKPDLRTAAVIAAPLTLHSLRLFRYPPSG
jgi:hypothetical protein